MFSIPFVPPDFDVPAGLETGQFRLRILTVDDVEKDYEAVMESQEMLLKDTNGRWPREGFTLAENLADLERHQREHLERQAFTYTVVSLDESKVLGCVYLNPDDDPEVDARIRMWVRQSEYERSLDPVLFETVRAWIESAWPFEKVVYPGRE
jgi:hypothetical protein